MRDAEPIAAELRGLGFIVTVRNNPSPRELSRVVDDFAGRIQSGDLAMFYYSGHGMQVDRENYLLPIDFEAARRRTFLMPPIRPTASATSWERSGTRLRVVILDACRDNLYKASKGGPSGLAPMGPPSGNGIGFRCAWD